jgi:hypothetical protein
MFRMQEMSLSSILTSLHNTTVYITLLGEMTTYRLGSETHLLWNVSSQLMGSSKQFPSEAKDGLVSCAISRPTGNVQGAGDVILGIL